MGGDGDEDAASSTLTLPLHGGGGGDGGQAAAADGLLEEETVPIRVDILEGFSDDVDEVLERWIRERGEEEAEWERFWYTSLLDIEAAQEAARARRGGEDEDEDEAALSLLLTLKRKKTETAEQLMLVVIMARSMLSLVESIREDLGRAALRARDPGARPRCPLLPTLARRLMTQPGGFSARRLQLAHLPWDEVNRMGHLLDEACARTAQLLSLRDHLDLAIRASYPRTSPTAAAVEMPYQLAVLHQMRLLVDSAISPVRRLKPIVDGLNGRKPREARGRLPRTGGSAPPPLTRSPALRRPAMEGLGGGEIREDGDCPMGTTSGDRFHGWDRRRTVRFCPPLI